MEELAAVPFNRYPDREARALRTAIGELLVPDAAIHRLVLEGGDQAAIQRAAVAGGMRTLYESGLLEVLAGTTTLAEMMRSVRAEE